MPAQPLAAGGQAAGLSGSRGRGSHARPPSCSGPEGSSRTASSRMRKTVCSPVKTGAIISGPLFRGQSAAL